MSRRSTPFVLATCLTAFLTAAGVALAQNPHRMHPNAMMKQFQDPAAMQRMSQQADAASKCMESIEQSDLDALEKKARTASAEIERLCKAGKKKEALAKGLALSREMNQNATVLKIRECTKDLNATMKQMMPTAIPGVDDASEPTDDDICS